MKIYLVGTKSDLVENRVISEEELRAQAEEFRVGYIEVSSKNGHNVDNLFYRIISDLQPLKAEAVSLRRKSLNGESEEPMIRGTREPLGVRNDSNVTADGQDGNDETIARSLQQLSKYCNCMVM